jgi:hypothetical protein
MEIENNKKLPFLDVLVVGKPEGMLGHGVYRKPTQTNKYLHADAHHHLCQKHWVLTTLALIRSLGLTDKETIIQELYQLKVAFKQNGYADRHTNYRIQWITKSNNRRTKTLTCFCSWYKIHNRSYRATYGGERHQTGINWQKDCTNIKTKNSKRSMTHRRYIKYRARTDQVYICEWGKKISTRTKEHDRAIRLKHMAIAERVRMNKHTVDTKKTKVLSRDKCWYQRHIREAIEIVQDKTNYNRDDGRKLSRAWTSIISNISRQPTWYMPFLYHLFLPLPSSPSATLTRSLSPLFPLCPY